MPVSAATDHHRAAAHQHAHHYASFAVELIIDFVIMYLVMFTMIATLGHFYNNLNMVYMTLMMVAPMAIVMLIAMRKMFPHTGLNIAIIAIAAAVFAVSFWAMRTQAAVGDRQFLRSMIPHHSGAILMCGKAKLNDPEIVKLCEEIIRSQQKEIDQMQTILSRL